VFIQKVNNKLIMKKLFFSFLFFALVAFQAISQNINVSTEMYEVFHCKNANGSIETLLVGERFIFYRNSGGSESEVHLKIVKSDKTDDKGNLIVGEDMRVQFPNNSKNYQLKTCLACPEVTCTNPDGSVQAFSLDYNTWGVRGTFRCVNNDKTLEYLRIEGVDEESLKVKYCSNKSPQWQTLKLSNIKMGDMGVILGFDVQFPKESQKYKIVSGDFRNTKDRNSFICISPKGTSQIFQWINK